MTITTPNFYAVAFPTFQPAMRNILSITPGEETIVTTTYNGVDAQNHQYESGLIVRFVIPQYFGMEQLHNMTATIEVINDTQFVVPINSTEFDPFVVPAYQPGHLGTPAQVVPHGEITQSLRQASRNVLPYP